LSGWTSYEGNAFTFTFPDLDARTAPTSPLFEQAGLYTDGLAEPHMSNLQRHTAHLTWIHEGHTVLSVVPTLDLMMQQRTMAYFTACRVFRRIRFTPGFKYKRTMSAAPEAWMHSTPVFEKRCLYLQTKGLSASANVETIHACFRSLIYKAKHTRALDKVVVWDTDEGIAQAA
jgi:hypothetical protein